jgi:hypothetical protein
MNRRMRTSTGISAAVIVAALGLAGCSDDQKASTSDTTDATPESTAPESTVTSTTEGSGSSTTLGQPVIDPGDGGNYHPDIDPANFVAEIDNPLWPLPAGAQWVYDGDDDGETEHIEVTVTDEQKEILGIPVTVVRDTVSDADGNVVEDTRDFYAQDQDGNVWYMGEDTAEYENGEVTSTHGSWEAGVDGALPGIVMPADPAVGDTYRQEYFKGEAEDLAEVIRTGETVTVASGTYDNVVVTREWNPLDPDVVEEKYYAPGVGVVMETKVQGGDGRIELTEYQES